MLLCLGQAFEVPKFKTPWINSSSLHKFDKSEAGKNTQSGD